FTRPPRISPVELEAIWEEQAYREPPYIDVVNLAEMKKTNRERDYAVIGELARRMTGVRDQFLYSRSARDLINLSDEHPEIPEKLAAKRPILRSIPKGLDRLEEALDKERRKLIHANEARLAGYSRALERWSTIWPDLEKRMSACLLPEAHQLMVENAEGVLPFKPEV
ncbi:MAG: hypothetical protein U9N73_12080, partial [Candidatus Auribacterota bacterium]|nr:hypothetical protein [Candidatus Auribacterota bacterium]